MAVLWSRALRDSLDNNLGFRHAMGGGKFCLYQGTVPTDPDAAIVGTLLVTCTASGGTLTAPVAPRWGLNCTVDGTFRPTLNSALIVPDVDIAATGVIATTLANVVTAINSFNGWIPLRAWMNGADGIIIEGPPMMGTIGNAWVLADGGTATTTVSTPTGGTLGARAGVAAVNNCVLGLSADGVISTSGIWSGTCAATGQANFFVWYGNPADDTGALDAAPWNCRRIIGSCGTAGADYVMASTSLTATKTHTVDTSTITMSETA